MRNYLTPLAAYSQAVRQFSHSKLLVPPPMNLLELVVAKPGDGGDPPLPKVLSNVPALAAGSAPTRDFVFSSRHGDLHQINADSFEMNRVDERITLGDVERWRFTNDSTLPHPVHLHGTQFQIIARLGGRNTVYPYEGGWKDTALVMPLETVEAAVRFDFYRGIFPLHATIFSTRIWE